MRQVNSRGLALLGLISLVGLSLVSLLVISGATRSLDVAIMRAAEESGGGPWAVFAQAGNVLGLTASLIPVAALAGLAIFKQGGRYDAILPILVLLLARLANTAVKCAVARPRPENEVQLIMTTPCDRFSFPSGHTMDSTALYGYLAIWVLTMVPGRRGRILGTVFALIPVAIGLSRVVLGVHWISDVAGGWLASLLLVCVTVLVWQRLMGPRARGTTPPRRP